MLKCDFDPTPVPLGMFHCPKCGEMVMGHMPHPDYSTLEDEMPDTYYEDEYGSFAVGDVTPDTFPDLPQNTSPTDIFVEMDDAVELEDEADDGDGGDGDGMDDDGIVIVAINPPAIDALLSRIFGDMSREEIDQYLEGK